MALHSKIILGLLIGLVFGIISVFIGLNDFVSDWIMPFGTIFVKMLKRTPTIIEDMLMEIINSISEKPPKFLKLILLSNNFVLVHLSGKLV